VLPEEIAEARHEAGVKGQRTAAANRLQARGTDIDWDAEPAPDTTVDPFAGLPDDHDFPASI
jgi:hypothetical protein